MADSDTIKKTTNVDKMRIGTDTSSRRNAKASMEVFLLKFDQHAARDGGTGRRDLSSCGGFVRFRGWGRPAMPASPTELLLSNVLRRGDQPFRMPHSCML
ncbi:hypothetical protein GCM10017786_72110 [Amycolatopsis deserti]|uniref:Uncharacterized protein n=1 Tax=Amycolatopsis deserti TaxID=185696 RepID=A0ABQ3JFK5_9PSEU|nr:hypothetical protein GCM10017786_72110 [Amycolatopsis deserti]